MSALSAWITAIFVAVVVTVVAELLFSDTRMSKFIRTVTATVTLLIIVAPLPSLIKSGGTGGGNGVLDYSPQLDEGYINFVTGKRLAAVESALETRKSGNKRSQGANFRKNRGRRNGNRTS